LRDLVIDKSRCAECFCRLTCAGGCHVNNTYPDCPPGYSEFCVHTRILTACTLLEDLGQSDLADELVDRPDALAALSRTRSDFILRSESGA
jgi:hypothetical protein